MSTPPLAVARPVAKAIAARQLVDALLDDIERAPARGQARARQQLRQDWAQIVLRHLDAYDQRSG